MSKPKQPWRQIFAHYIHTFRQVWSIRHQLDHPPRHKDELAFLPAQLEITETPVGAAPKWTARLIITFALLTLLWAMLGQMQIVAVATGKTVSSDRRKTIQPIETAQVVSIAVHEG